MIPSETPICTNRALFMNRSASKSALNRILLEIQISDRIIALECATKGAGCYMPDQARCAGICPERRCYGYEISDPVSLFFSPFVSHIGKNPPTVPSRPPRKACRIVIDRKR